MALITCPLCGRENVSDKAERCPECNIPIAEYLKAQPNFGKPREVTSCAECGAVIPDDFMTQCPSCAAKIPGRKEVSTFIAEDFYPMCPKCGSRNTDKYNWEMKRRFFIGKVYFMYKYWCKDCGHLFRRSELDIKSML